MAVLQPFVRRPIAGGLLPVSSAISVGLSRFSGNARTHNTSVNSRVSRVARAHGERLRDRGPRVEMRLHMARRRQRLRAVLYGRRSAVCAARRERRVGGIYVHSGSVKGIMRHKKHLRTKCNQPDAFHAEGDFYKAQKGGLSTAFSAALRRHGLSGMRFVRVCEALLQPRRCGFHARNRDESASISRRKAAFQQNRAGRGVKTACGEAVG